MDNISSKLLKIRASFFDNQHPKIMNAVRNQEWQWDGVDPISKVSPTQPLGLLV